MEIIGKSFMGEREPPFEQALHDVLRSASFSLLTKRTGIHLLSLWKFFLSRQDKLPSTTQFIKKNQEKS
jgi:hypothetical protein